MQSRKFFSAIAVLLALACVCSPTAWAQYGASLSGNGARQVGSESPRRSGRGDRSGDGCGPQWDDQRGRILSV